MSTQICKRGMLAVALASTVFGPAYAQSDDQGGNQRGNSHQTPFYGYGPGGGYAPGMMGGYGYGPGMMGGYGPGHGYGYGPGMMGGGYGYGPGMMGGYGPGYGYGPGMMPGYGRAPGFGMIGLGPIGMLDLDAQQRDKIEQIHQALQKQNWDLMGKLQQERQQMAQLFDQDKVDGDKVASAYDRIASLRKQILQNHVQARNEIQSTLTAKQQQQLQQWRQGAAFGAPGAGGFGDFGDTAEP